MKKLFILLTLAGAIICTITNNNLVAENLKNFEMASLTSLTDQENNGGESLTPSEGGDNLDDNEELTSSEDNQGSAGSYMRKAYKCDITIFGNEELDLFKKGVIKVDGQGNYYVDGGIECKCGGSAACSAIDCRQVYKSIGL